MNSRALKHPAINLFSLLLLVTIAYSWLVFPYFLHGDDLLFETGAQVRNERLESYSELRDALTRSINFPNGVNVSALYATAEYLRHAEPGTVVETNTTDNNLVFIIDEEKSGGVVAAGLPETELIVSGRVYRPVKIEGPVTAAHHRKTVVMFDVSGDAGQSDNGSETTSLVLRLVRPWDRYTVVDGGSEADASAWRWDLPLESPQVDTSRHGMNGLMLLSLAAGLLSSILTPCLMQLVLVFFATVAGLSVADVNNSAAVIQRVRLRILWKTVFFILVFVTLFIITGAMIGYAGKEAQIIFTEVNRAAAAAAGTVVILFGTWIGMRSRLPLVCRLPGAALAARARGMGLAGMFIVSVALSLGCLSCYGGFIMGTLIIYIGTLDSAFNGAVVLGLFAAGVAVPFLAAAVSYTRMQNLYEFISSHTRTVGTISMVVIVGFGILLVTNSYHEVSDYIYPFLGLD